MKYIALFFVVYILLTMVFSYTGVSIESIARLFISFVITVLARWVLGKA